MNAESVANFSPGLSFGNPGTNRQRRLIRTGSGSDRPKNLVELPNEYLCRRTSDRTSDRPRNRLEIAKHIYPRLSLGPVATAPGSDVDPLCTASPR